MTETETRPRTLSTPARLALVLFLLYVFLVGVKFLESGIKAFGKDFTDNLFAISSEPLEGSRMGLAIASGVDSIMVVESTDARGFSDQTLMYEPGTAMNFGTVALALPAGDTCELNPYHPDCLTGPMFWEVSMLGDEGFVPGAVYLDVADDTPAGQFAALRLWSLIDLALPRCQIGIQRSSQHQIHHFATAMQDGEIEARIPDASGAKR